MQAPDITSRRFGMAFTSFRSDSGVEWCQARRYAMVDGCVSAKKIKPYSAVRVRCISGNPRPWRMASNAAPKVRRLSHICKKRLRDFFIPPGAFFITFQIFPIDDVSGRIERLAAVKRHDIMVNVIHHIDVVVLRVACRVRAGDHVIQRQQRMILGSGSRS